MLVTPSGMVTEEAEPVYLVMVMESPSISYSKSRSLRVSSSSAMFTRGFEAFCSFGSGSRTGAASRNGPVEKGIL